MAATTELNSAATRRGFLAGSSAALVIGFTLPGLGRAATAAKAAAPAGAAFHPNAWLRITPDNHVTVLCGSSEMGQGVLTAIPMLMVTRTGCPGSQKSWVATRRRMRSAKLRDSVAVVSGRSTTNSSPP